MRIKIKRRFRSVLSLLVTVMLLVGVMPSSVWESITANAAVTLNAGETMRIYFCPRPANNYSFSFDDAYIYVYGKRGTGTTDEALVYGTYTSSNQTKKGPTKMNYVLGSAKIGKGNGDNHTEHNVYYYDITAPVSENWSISGIIFTNSGDTYGWSGGQQTKDITANIADGTLFYLNGGSGTQFTCGYYTNYEVHPYVTFSDRTMAQDTNIPTGEGFEKDTSGNREYYSATFYDYFSDYELKTNSSRNTKTSYSDQEQKIIGVRGYGYHVDSGIKNIPTFTLNSELSEYYSTNSANIKYPIYFGNFKEQANSYQFTEVNNAGLNKGLTSTSSSSTPWLWYGSSDTTLQGYQKFYYANNSVARTSGNTVNFSGNSDVAAQGLYADKLADDGSGNNKQGYLQLSSNTANNVRAPFFNSSWLTTNKVGASYSVEMPFFKNGDYWELDSSKQTEALRMRRYVESGTTKYYYLEETNTGISGVENYSPSNESGKKKGTFDFLPFNSSSDFDALNGTKYYFDQVNYNFAFDVTIPFSLTSDGTVTGNNGDPIIFSFSGDDDLVAYLDGDLVLDIGGDHGAVTGSINFATLESTVSRVKQPNSTTDKTNEKFYLSSVLDKNNDGDLDDTYTEDGKTYPEDIRGDNKIHYLKVFCMERGLFESNVKITHNLPTIQKRSFTVDTEVVTGNVDPIFTDTYTTAGTNFVNNINMIDFDIDVQFSKANDANTYELVTFGDTPNVYKTSANSQTTTPFDSNSIDTYSFLQKNDDNEIMLYVNDFIQKNDHYLKVSENSGHQLRFKGSSSGTTIDGKTIGDLFTCSWDLRLKNAGSSSGVSGRSQVDGGNDTFGPVHTTETGSRPARTTKTTSTSAATNITPYFDFAGTVDDPDKIVFTNTIQTKTLQITKSLANTDGLTADQNFSIQITFDKVGGEDIQLEEPRNASTGALITGGTDVTITKPYTFTLTNSGGYQSQSMIPINVPVNTTVTITELYVADGKNPTYTVTGSSGATTSGASVTFTITNDTNVAMSNPNPSNPTPPEPQPIVLKIQKVWGSGIDTNKPTVSFLIKRDGSPISRATATAIDAGGNAVTITDGGMITLSSGSGTATATGGTNDRRGAWVVYVFDTTNTNASTITYSITEYYNGNPVTQTNNVYSFTVGTGDDAVTYQVSYTPGGLPPASANGGNYLSLPLSDSEFSGIANFATTYAAYINNNDTPGDTTDDTVRVLPLSVLNTKPTQTPTPETGGRGGYVPIAGGFIAILLAGAGYFIYKKRLFA